MTLKIIMLSLRAIYNNKMRSFLTMLGIIIGVMAVVILVSITQNATSGITDSIASMGSDQITASITGEDVSVSRDSIETLNSYGAIDKTAPVITTSQTVKHNGETGSYSIVGVTNDYFDVQDIAIQSGRLIADSDIEWTTNVAVIGTEAATDLFGTWDAVGGTITIGERNYKVIGVLEEQGSSLVGSDDSKILIPYTTAERITGQKSVSTFYIKASSSNSVNVAINMVESFLLQTTRDEDSFTVNNQSDVLDTMDEVNNTMSLLLAGIAAISLLVGGIGIMNIMLVSVTERTSEIGLKKAIGARKKVILGQFLTEASVLTSIGGIIGVVLGIILSKMVSQVSGAPTAISVPAIIGSVVFSMLIGLIFGLLPSVKAANLNPIDALRSE